MTYRHDRLSDDKIALMNTQECWHDDEFFNDFIRSITVYEDDDIWVGDKPAGLLSVDGRTLKVSLQSRLLRVYPNIKLIHRLDMDTSGLIIFAKNEHSQSHIAKQFIDRMVNKEYQAVVFGTMEQADKKGVIDVPVRYEPTTKPRHIVDMNHNKRALTHYKVMHHELRTDKAGKVHVVTRLALYPVTGRSHQLRVHCVHVGHVMIGDPIYAALPQKSTALELAPRLNLHAHKLRLKHPVYGVWLDWESEVPF